MKLVFVVTIVLAAGFCLTAIAQESPIDKGSMFIGGGASFTSFGGDLYEWGSDGRMSLISGTPEFGYFVSPGFYLGGRLLFMFMTQGGDDASLFGIGPVVGYYFNSSKSRTEIKGAVYPYIKSFFIYQSLSEGNWDVSQTSFGGIGGINYMLSNAVALDFGVSFSVISSESISGNVLSIGAGITYFIW